MQQAHEIIAFLIDKGDPEFVAEDYTEHDPPWPDLITVLMAEEPLKRAEVFEAEVNRLDGANGGMGADEVRAAVYGALNRRFQRKREDDGGLTEVVPALDDHKEALEAKILYDALAKEEDGDAAVFTELFEGQVAYDHAEGQWYLWGGQYWEPDSTNAIINLLRTEVAGQYAQRYTDLIKEDKSDTAKPYGKRAERLHTRRRKEHVLWAAASRPGLALSGDEWDSHPWLLGTPNGVIDLETGEFRSGRPRDWIRTVIPTTWQGLDTPAPRWESFLTEIFDNDQQIVEFAHRLLGYGLTGLTTEHAFPILWGPQGRNGKSTFLETLASTLGPDITMSIPSEELMYSYRGGNTGPQPYIVKMRGKRLIWSSETNPDRRLDGEMVKKLTGGDRIHAHAKYANPIEFSPTHLLLLLTNHKPKIEAQDNAIWDRVHLIPFELRFVDNPIRENERPRDPYLPHKLREEREGILAWLVRGCLAWQDRGRLDPPPQVAMATEEYRGDEDTIGQFIDDYCVVEVDAQVRHMEFYKAYKQWCKDLDLWHSGSRDFGNRIKQLFPHKKTNRGMTYEGIGLPINAPAGQSSF
jgi:putative DNA primase/helicase